MKKIRLISPFISVLLITLVLSGSFGFTLIRHTCFHCGTDETIAAISGGEVDSTCNCHHGEDRIQPHDSVSQVLCDGCCSSVEDQIILNHGIAEYEVKDDCCTHETERVVTDELFRAVSHTEIVPYFLAATIIAVLEEAPSKNIRYFPGDIPVHSHPDLTTLFCRIQS